MRTRLPFILALVLFSSSPGRAEDALNLFTNIAERLLHDQYGLSVTCIPLAPTNAYTAGVHRLLQVSANICDATRNDPYPLVLRPLCTSNAAGVYICGYTNDNRLSTLSDYLADGNDHGLPFVISARKGIPNFNEFSLQSYVEGNRLLQVVRNKSVTLLGSKITSTNQMFILGMSNLIGVEVWNSSTSDFPNKVSLRLTNLCTVTLTNETGVLLSNALSMSSYVQVDSNAWKGWRGPRGLSNNDPSFKLPLLLHATNLPRSVYYTQRPTAVPTSSSYNYPAPEAPTNGYPRFITVETNTPMGVVTWNYGFDTNIIVMPQGWLKIQNRLRYMLVDETDADNQRILDYVEMDGLITETNLPPTGLRAAYSGGDFWNTNRINGSTNPGAVTIGVFNQIEASLGDSAVPAEVWHHSDQFIMGQNREKTLDTFRVFMGLSPLRFKPTEIVATNTSYQAPFTPAFELIQHKCWAANDPLVHYMVENLDDWAKAESEGWQFCYLSVSLPTNNNVGKLNPSFRPWGGNPQNENAANLSMETDIALKDPNIKTPDDWDFPTNQALSLNWLGRVHRGTPWQTIYLKAPVASTHDWAVWGFDPTTHPTNDWRLASLLAPLFLTNDPLARLSVNSQDTNAWLAALNGLTVFTNSDPASALVMQAGSPEAAAIARAIVNAHAGGRYFRNVGDLFSVPEVAANSPWLASTGGSPYEGLNDEACEAISAQVLARLRPDVVGSIESSNHQPQLRFNVFAGHNYRLEMSTDLLHWDKVSEQFCAEEQMVFPLTDVNERRFYRLVLLPAQ